MKFDLMNQVALVTGAGRGIGRCISLRLAEAGAHVVLTSRTIEQLKNVEQEIIDGGGMATSFRCDVSKEEDVLSMFKSLKEKLGKLDILINNAAVGSFGKLWDFPVKEFDRIISVNLRGVFLCSQQAMKMMIPARKGYIINISSVVGIKGYPNQSAYTASKHGVMGLTKSLAVEAKEYNIRVSAILPGVVETDMALAARPDLDPSVLLKPDDIASSVMYLLSLSDRAAVDQIYIRRKASSPF